MREIGTVRFYDSKKGYGFVTRDNGAGDLHISVRALPRMRKWDPETGDRVSYEVRESNKGAFAAKVDFVKSGAGEINETQDGSREAPLHRDEESAGGQAAPADDGGGVPDCG